MNQEEAGDLVCGKAPVLEGDRDGLVGQRIHALSEVDDGEECSQAPGFLGLERIQSPELVDHLQIISRCP